MKNHSRTTQITSKYGSGGVQSAALNMRCHADAVYKAAQTTYDEATRSVPRRALTAVLALPLWTARSTIKVQLAGPHREIRSRFRFADEQASAGRRQQASTPASKMAVEGSIGSPSASFDGQAVPCHIHPQGE